jgi:hypothetical protein
MMHNEIILEIMDYGEGEPSSLTSFVKPRANFEVPTTLLVDRIEYTEHWGLKLLEILSRSLTCPSASAQICDKLRPLVLHRELIHHRQDYLG